MLISKHGLMSKMKITSAGGIDLNNHLKLDYYFQYSTRKYFGQLHIRIYNLVKGPLLKWDSWSKTDSTAESLRGNGAFKTLWYH